eukprot:TRINITY_DN16652_c0_g1_i1.p1 TRINITY_DN16652_c0_g1~~TRINITY_DN16652_c0_g1_i1.p1  ORF type:complete len:1212 (+),score=368.15 TRINITY_DN16652_c0_g1_i1:60-3638(+)
MWIKQVIIDGFKSYAHRTVIGPFDREFNAITGLNGSGKSNILDAVCFVFAISNLHKVRVRDISELIYKSGQAGISKASVTIDFDNTDEEGKPPGFPDCDTITVTRQIVTAGRNKFFINGTGAQLQQVQNLFHSVQLNVNNPHFLIMQGTITKVLNMKPVERLSMLQEAAGTRMFEQKKTSAQAMVQKKDIKLSEIDRQLEEDMKPTLQKREADRREYDLYLQGKSTITQLSRMKQAYDYEHLAETCTRLSNEARDIAGERDGVKTQISDLADSIEELAEEVESLKGMHATSLTFGLGASQKDFDDANKTYVTKQAELRNSESEAIKQESAVKKLVQEEGIVQRNLKSHDSETEKAKQDLIKQDTLFQEYEVMVENFSRQLQLLKSGIAASAEGVSLTEQLDRYKKQLIQCEGAVRQADLLKSQSEQQLKTKKTQARHTDSDYATMKRQLQEGQDSLAAAEEKLKQQTGGYDEAKEKELRETIREMAPKVSQLEHEVLQLETVTKSALDIQYKRGNLPSDMEGKVMGVIAKLINVKEEKYTTALTQAAGRAMYNLVVDNEQTGKKMMKEVRNRVTIIPLNKITDQVCPPDMCKIAEKAAKSKGGEAKLALELITYSDEVAPAVRFVFGKRFICSDINTAAAVTFHKDVKQVSVTTDGEVVQPGGVMQGGSTKDLDKTLALYGRYLTKKEVLKKVKEELVTLEKQHAQILGAGHRFEEQKQALESQRRGVDTLKYKLSTNQQHQIAEQITKLESQIEEAEASATTNKAKAENLKKEIGNLDTEVKKGGDIDKKKKEAEGKLVKVKQDIKALQPKRTDTRKKVAEADATKSEMEGDLGRIQSDKQEEESKLAQLKSTIQRRKRELETIKEGMKEKEDAMNELKDKLTSANTGVAVKQRELSNLKDMKGDLNAKVERLNLRHKELSKMLDDKQKKLKELEKTGFVVENKKNFGKNGDLDWRAIDYVKEFARLESLKTQDAKMSKCVNHKVVAMYESVEAQYKDVLEKREQVQRDKEHVLRTIEELDEQKKKTIGETFAKVSKDFSSIFSSLLPGARAQLKGETSNSTITGLTIRVAMGNNWKESLTELSGGQRSLLALSYILSLLKYKPAPVYILDEVDAALDLSHTQNIGKMLSTHFKNSQFLVVSLKEGMFNNANVLFRVRLADGQSQVVRHDNTIKKRPNENATENASKKRRK